MIIGAQSAVTESEDDSLLKTIGARVAKAGVAWDISERLHRAFLLKRNVCFFFYLVIAVLVAAQLFMRADVVVLFCLAGISVLGVAAIQLRTVYFSEMFVFILSLYSGLLALLFKTIVGQPVDVNLDAPQLSAFYALLGFVSISAAALAAFGRRHSNTGILANVRKRYADPHFAESIATPVFLVGAAFNGLHVAVRPVYENNVLEQQGGFGGFGTFHFLLYLGVCLQLYVVACFPTQSRKQKLLFFGVVAILLSVMADVKKDFADFVLAILLSMYAFGFRIRMKDVLIPVAAVLVFAVVVNPVIHIMRSQIGHLSISERISYAWETLEKANFNPTVLNEDASRVFRGFQYVYTPQGSYFYPDTSNFDRFALIKPIDQVTENLDHNGLLGIAPLVNAAANWILPSFLVTKNSMVGADLIAWHYGIRTYGTIARPVIGLTASNLAAAGFIGIVLLPWVVVFPLMRLADRITGPLIWNPWCLFWVVACDHLAEKEFDAMIESIFREIPIVFVSCFLIMTVHSLFQKPRRYQRISVLARVGSIGSRSKQVGLGLGAE